MIVNAILVPAPRARNLTSFPPHKFLIKNAMLGTKQKNKPII